MIYDRHGGWENWMDNPDNFPFWRLVGVWFGPEVDSNMSGDGIVELVANFAAAYRAKWDTSVAAHEEYFENDVANIVSDFCFAAEYKERWAPKTHNKSLDNG